MDLDGDSIAGNPFIGPVVMNHQTVTVKQIDNSFGGGVTRMSAFEQQRGNSLSHARGEQWVGAKRWIFGD